MGNFTYLLLVLFISSLFLVNCKKDDDENKVTPSMTATVNGEEWNASLQITGHLSNDVLEMYGSKTSGNAIDINIEATSTGTYEFDGSYESKAIYTKNIGGLPKAYITNANSGQVTITEFSSSVVKGTFNFVAYATFAGNIDSVIVENGAFTLEYTSNK